MAEDYIPRSIEPLIVQIMGEYAAVLITGPRQVGKSTLLAHIAGESGCLRNRVTLDDLTVRELATTDPTMFFQVYEPPILIDEVQYAPNLFSRIKMMIDAGMPPGSFWLTGSQQFRLMELAGESLAGRAAILSLSSLTQVESERMPRPGFSFDLDLWMERQRAVPSRPVRDLYSVMLRGQMPGVVSGKFTNVPVFYESYLRTYIERDVRRLLGDVDALQYVDFMRAAAARCSQMLNVASIAQDVGIRPDKAKTWLAMLERSGVIFFLHPFSNNQLKRTVKAPKLYFHDCGLVAHLTRWLTPETLEAGAMSGAFMENYVVSEVYKSFLNSGMEPPLYYYRDHDGKEVDLIVEVDGQLHPVEIKKTATPQLSMVKNFKTLRRGSAPLGRGAIVCAAENVSALNGDVLVIPARLL